MHSHLIQEKELHKEQKLLILFVFPAAFFIAGLCIALIKKEWILPSLKHILISPTILITDFLAVGGISATLLNASFTGFFNLYLLKKYKLRINGLLIAAYMAVMGFSFFGKNILNILPIYLGGYLYSKYQKLSFKDILLGIMFGTALAPVVSEITFSGILPANTGLFLGLIAGIFIGFVIVPLSSHMLKFHSGYNIYNIGFTAGILGTILTSILRSFKMSIEPVMIIYSQNNLLLILLLTFLFTFLLICGIIINKRAIMQYPLLFSYSGAVVTDFTHLVGYGITFLNMGLMGLLSLLYVLLVGGVLNGPAIAAIFSVTGFSAFGKHLKNCLPIVLGASLAALTLNFDLSSTPIIITVLFSTTVAPIAGGYGVLSGIVAGMLHLVLATNVGVIHGGINLYNNGFAGGLVAGFLVPILNAFKKGEDE